MGRPATTDPNLTSDEIRLLAALAEGATENAAARLLGVSPRTVRRRARVICDRLGVETTIEAVVWAAKRGLV